MRVLKMLEGDVFNKLRHRESFSGSEKVYVYYSFSDYRDDIAYLRTLSEVVSMLRPGVNESDMHVFFVDPQKSVSHSGKTVIRVAVPVKDIKNVIEEGYTML